MPTVEERLASLEARVDAMSDVRTLIGALQTDTNARFAELRADMNARFTVVDGRIGSLDAKIDRHFVWLMGMMLTGFITVIGALVGLVSR